MGVVLWCQVALAQTALLDSVDQRQRPEHDPNGIVVDSFLLLPSFQVSVEHTDNLFKTGGDKVSDQAVVVRPGFVLQSDWDRHAAQLFGNLEYAKYLENSEEDSLDFELGAAGRLDVGAEHELNAEAAIARSHLDRGSPDDPGGDEPAEEYTGRLAADGVYRFFPMFAKLGVVTEKLDARDAGPVNHDDRDRLQIEGRARLGYEWVPGSSAFIEGAYNRRQYSDEVDDNGFRRSSDGWEILVGNTMDLSGVTFAEFGVGYRRQVFDQQTAGAFLKPTLDTVEGFSFLGRLLWNPTDLLTLTGEARREVRETTVPGASSAFASTFDLKADYELLPNLILNGLAQYDIEEFEGIGRQDDFLRLGIGARYLIGRNLVVEVGYEFEDRDSDAADDSFTENMLILSLKAQL